MRFFNQLLVYMNPYQKAEIVFYPSFVTNVVLLNLLKSILSVSTIHEKIPFFQDMLGNNRIKVFSQYLNAAGVTVAAV